MGFPVWHLDVFSGGFLIALISVIHVFVAQFAVGGGFFLVFAERYAQKQQSRPILEWVQTHTRFFLLLTMVFGGLTGVGIWLIISLVAPHGVSFLIQNFVFIWAIEWAFFLGEILALLVYYYSFPHVFSGRMAAKEHLTVGYLYALFAWLSLFAINGIISFMLTPGAWLESKSLWDAFFNPSFFPSLLFRTGLCLTLAGLFGLVTCRKIADMAVRQLLVRWCALWIAVPFVLMLPSAWWYWCSIPADVQAMILRRTEDIRPYLSTLFLCGPIIFLIALLAIAMRARFMTHPLALLALLALGLALVGSFEYVRESGRRPWLIPQHMYSNGFLATDTAMLQRNGSLAHTGWAGVNPLSEATLLQTGRFIFAQQCSSCHGISGPSLPIIPRIITLTPQGIDAILAGQGKLRGYMPPFLGTDAERQALTRYLFSLHPPSPLTQVEGGSSGISSGVRHD